MLDFYPSRSLRFGMPHLTPGGVSLNWIARECCDMHWWAIGLRLGVSPAEIRDLSGERVFASVTNCSVEGRLDRFREGEAVNLALVTPPSPQSGWRSRSLLSSEAAETVRLDIVTVFAKRAGSSNRQLVAAEMPDSEAPLRQGRDASLAEAMRARARAIRAAAQADERPPHLSFKIYEASDMNGVGLVYFANFLDFFERAEANALPPAGAPFVSVRREIHYFGNIDAGDYLDIVSEATAPMIAPHAEAVVRSHACRLSDGRLIAACETRRTQLAALPADRRFSGAASRRRIFRRENAHGHA